MRPKGTRKYFHQRLTAKEKQKIVARLRRPGAKQIEVARHFGLCVDTVRAVQRAAGVRRYAELTPEVEAKAVELLNRGTAFGRVAKMLRLPGPRVRELMGAHGIVRKVGGVRLEVSEPERVERIRDAVRKRENYCKHVAKKYRTSPETVRRIAHQVHGEGRLLGFPVWPPMLSVFPQKNFDVKQATHDDYLELVHRVLEQCFDRVLPSVNDLVFVNAMMAAFTQTTLIGQPQPVVDCFAAGLRDAVSTLRTSQTGWTN